MENTGLTIVLITTFCFHCVIPWQLLVCTISFKITSIYINLSSQNLHSAIAALKQEAKPLTTLNIKASWRHEKRDLEGRKYMETWRQRERNG